MKYKHISQKPYCCVPACIQMILKRKKARTPSQTNMAYDFGVVLPEKDRHLLPRSYAVRRPKAGWGTRIDVKRYSLTSFFKKRKFPLKEKYYPASSFRSEKMFGELMINNIRKENDMLICFNYPLLYDKKGSHGHASLIEEVKGKSVILQDPNSKTKRAQRVPLHKLFVAIQHHYKGGVWVISDTDEIQ